MRIVQLRLANIMCFEQKTVELGRITTVTGANGVGKSTIAESFKNLIGGGNDVTLLRAGAEEGEIALLLDDGMEITKRITPKGSTVTVKHPVYGKISKPQSVIESLAQLAAVNPAQFLMLPDRKRAEFLQEVCPIEVRTDEVEEILADAGLTLGADGLADAGSGIDGLDTIRRWVYDQRTAANGAAKEKRGTIDTLRTSLPADSVELERDIRAEIAEKQRVRAEIVEAGEKRIEDISNAALLEAQRIGNAKQAQAEKAGLRRSTELSAIDRQIHELERQREKVEADYHSELTRIEYEGSTERDAVMRELDARKQAIRDEVLPQVTAIDAELVALAEADRHAERYRHVAHQVERFAADLSELEARAATLSAAIERLDALKRQKLSQLPIPGIEIRDGVIYRNGVPFDRLNTAQRVGIAFDLAVLRAGRLPFVFVDGAECLDADTLAELARRADEAGVQLMTLGVANGPLEIRTDVEVAA